MKSPSRSKPIAPATDWGGVSGWYDQLVGDVGSEYHQHVVLPGTNRLLLPQPNQRIVDFACGQGVLCRQLAAKGVHMVGIDAAPDLIRAAKSREPVPAPGVVTPGSIQYQVADVREPSTLPAGTYDAVACVLAIQNIHPIAPVFTHAATLLKPMGKLVLVMMHPAFRQPKQTSWGWDAKEMIQYRRVDRYLLPRKTPITTHPGAASSGRKGGEAYTWSFHKPIETYVKALRNAGLLIDALEEWPSHKKSDSGPRAPAENTAREEIPMFLAIRALKVASTAPLADTSS